VSRTAHSEQALGQGVIPDFENLRLVTIAGSFWRHEKASMLT